MSLNYGNTIGLLLVLIKMLIKQEDISLHDSDKEYVGEGRGYAFSKYYYCRVQRR